MAVSCSNSSVTISQSGSLSGSATISDGTNTLATIPASGSPTKGGSGYDAGTNRNWTLTVTWKSDNTAQGSAAGPFQNGTQTVIVPVLVDHGGGRTPQHKGRRD